MKKQIFGTLTVLGLMASSLSQAGDIFNLSVRTDVAGNFAKGPLIAGFMMNGGAPTNQVLIRGIGPGLAAFGVPNTADDPYIELYQNTAQIGGNNNWDSSLASVFSAVGAFGLPAGSADAAMLATVSSGISHSVKLYTHPYDTKQAMVELYDAQPDSTSFTNLSVRNYIFNGSELIAGFVITGSNTKVLIRGMGPSLACFGVSDALERPYLTVYSNGTPIATNDAWWKGGVNTQTHYNELGHVGAFRYCTPSLGSGYPTFTDDTAVILTLAPGAYTVSLRNNPAATPQSGTGLIEVYDAD